MINKFNLVGREREADELSSLLGRGNGSFILVSGEAGIGKTVFTEEVLKRNNIKFYSARPLENAAPPYSMLTSILRNYIREEKNKKIYFGPLTNYLSVLLPEIKSEPKEADRETLVQAIADALTIISKEKSTAIFFDDIHLSDGITIELLPSLSDKLNDTAVTILASCRSDEVLRSHKIRWLRNKFRRRKKLTEFNLPTLNEEHTGKLIAYLLKNKISSSLIKVIYKKTQGVPLFIEELCAALRDKKILSLKDGELILESEQNIPLPESIKDAVLLKINELSVNAKRLLETAAIAGEEFELNIFKSVARNDEGIEELFRYAFIREKEGGKAEFKHTLIREAVKSEIPWNLKVTLNKKIAEYLSERNYHPGIIALHWLEANETDIARKYFVKSAERSCKIQAYADAARSASRALKLWSEGIEEKERIETMLQLANCAQLSGQPDEAIKVLKEITMDAGVDHKSLANTYRLLAATYGLKGKWDRVADARKTSAQYFENEKLFDDAAAEYLAATARFTSLMDLSEALSCSEKAFILSEQSKNINIQSRALGLMGNITAMLGKPDKGQEIVRKGLDLALKYNLTEAASEIYRRLASTMEYRSDYISAKSAYNNAYSFCITTGSEVYAQICLGCMSYIFFQTCEWKKALEVCNDVLQNKKSPDGSKNAAMVVTGLIYAFRGQIKSAEKFLNRSHRLAEKIKNNIVFFSVYWGKGITAEIQNDNEGMLLNYLEVLDLWKTLDDRHDSIPILMWGANVFSRNNKEKELVTCVENLSVISNETSNPEALSALAFALGEHFVQKNKLNEAAEKFEQALLHQEKVVVPYEKMFIEKRLGEILLGIGDRERATEHLKSSYSIAKNLGIRPYASEISLLLAEAGYKTDERIRKNKYSPAESNHLTRRQNEILKLISEGLTNKEIADKMFLSTRTVDMHVSHILERLNCRTRTEAINRARELKLV